jgi:hypothetical protein
MRFRPTNARVFAWALGLSAMLMAPARSQAQDVIYSGESIDQSQHHPHHHGWGFFHSRHPAIPRTYSYYYNRWFNRPHHVPVVGADGKTYWRTTVRGLPLGTPWPPDGILPDLP